MPDGSDSPEIGPQADRSVTVLEKAAVAEKSPLELATSWLNAASTHYTGLYGEIEKRYTVPGNAPHLSGDTDKDQAIIEEYGGKEEVMPLEEWSKEDQLLANHYLQTKESYDDEVLGLQDDARHIADSTLPSGGLEDEAQSRQKLITAHLAAVSRYADLEKARQRSISERNIDSIASQVMNTRVDKHHYTSA